MVETQKGFVTHHPAGFSSLNKFDIHLMGAPLATSYIP
ncbi:hypothetical protein V6Z11_D07G020800 [Gossypium hirsutum]